MSSFVSSPVWGAVISVTGAALIGLVAMLSRVLSKVTSIEQRIGELAQDVIDARADKDVVRWSEIARDRRRHKRYGF